MRRNARLESLPPTVDASRTTRLIATVKKKNVNLSHSHQLNKGMAMATIAKAVSVAVGVVAAACALSAGLSTQWLVLDVGLTKVLACLARHAPAGLSDPDSRGSDSWCRGTSHALSPRPRARARAHPALPSGVAGAVMNADGTTLGAVYYTLLPRGPLATLLMQAAQVALGLPVLLP